MVDLCCGDDYFTAAMAHLLAFLMPIVVLLLPALKFAPMIYRWRVQARSYRTKCCWNWNATPSSLT